MIHTDKIVKKFFLLTKKITTKVTKLTMLHTVNQANDARFIYIFNMDNGLNLVAYVCYYSSNYEGCSWSMINFQTYTQPLKTQHNAFNATRPFLRTANFYFFFVHLSNFPS